MSTEGGLPKREMIDSAENSAKKSRVDETTPETKSMYEQELFYGSRDGERVYWDTLQPLQREGFVCGAHKVLRDLSDEISLCMEPLQYQEDEATTIQKDTRKHVYMAAFPTIAEFAHANCAGPECVCSDMAANSSSEDECDDETNVSDIDTVPDTDA